MGRKSSTERVCFRAANSTDQPPGRHKRGLCAAGSIGAMFARLWRHEPQGIKMKLPRLCRRSFPVKLKLLKKVTPAQPHGGVFSSLSCDRAEISLRTSCSSPSIRADSRLRTFGYHRLYLPVCLPTSLCLHAAAESRFRTRSSESVVPSSPTRLTRGEIPGFRSCILGNDPSRGNMARRV